MKAGGPLSATTLLGPFPCQGARVFLGKGAGRGARLRAKALVVGGRMVFVGSANLTGKALRSAELFWLLFTGAASGLGAMARFIERFGGGSAWVGASGSVRYGKLICILCSASWPRRVCCRSYCRCQWRLCAAVLSLHVKVFVHDCVGKGPETWPGRRRSLVLLTLRRKRVRAETWSGRLDVYNEDYSHELHGGSLFCELRGVAAAGE